MALNKDQNRCNVTVKAALKIAFMRTGLDILLSECPKGCTLTIWADEQMVRRLEPSSTQGSVCMLPCPRMPIQRGDCEAWLMRPNNLMGKDVLEERSRDRFQSPFTIFLWIGKILEQEWCAWIVAIYRTQREVLAKMIL